MSINLEDFQNYLEEAISAIANLKEEAENVREVMEQVIDACEIIEDL